MSVVIADEMLAEELIQTDEPVEVQTRDGRRIGVFMPDAPVPESGSFAGKTVREILDWIAANRVTPPPGSPDSTELLREGRDR